MAREIPYLDVQNLTKSFGSLLLFEDISFSIAEGQKVGLIAKNGTGKSTLLTLLIGKDSADSGSIIYRHDLKIGMLEQSPVFDPKESVLDACFNHENDPEKVLKAKQILTKLKIRDLQQPMGQLSGGQQKRVALANVLITEPDMLILDEPTNHLDLEMIEWLEGFLNRGNKTLLMVTHDRYFLDRVCSVILELDDQTIYTYRGNYSYYLEKRQERIDNRRAEIARANNLYRTELEWMRRMPQARGHKAKSREDAFYELERVAKARIEERAIRLKASNVYIGSKIFECQYISKEFRVESSELRDVTSGDANVKSLNSQHSTLILKDFYYNFSRFEKMGIVGNNGTGKSTFVKMLLGELQPDSGRIVIGDTVRFGYFSQEGLQFREDQKVIDVVRDIAEYVDLGQGRHLTATQLLQHFLFTNEQQYNYVAKLSGGERRKLYLCTVLMRQPNFLVLDEPTNDLDIVTLQILEEYLQDFPGCVIVVSHDRYFMDKIIDHLLVFEGDGVIKDFPGNYTQYRQWQQLQPKGGATQATATATAPKKDYHNDTRRRMSFKEKMEFERLTKEIEQLEAEQKQIEDALCSGTLSIDELTEKSKRLPVLKDELDEKSLRWLELSEIEN